MLFSSLLASRFSSPQIKFDSKSGSIVLLSGTIPKVTTKQGPLPASCCRQYEDKRFSIPCYRVLYPCTDTSSADVEKYNAWLEDKLICCRFLRTLSSVAAYAGIFSSSLHFHRTAHQSPSLTYTTLVLHYTNTSIPPFPVLTTTPANFRSHSSPEWTDQVFLFLASCRGFPFSVHYTSICIMISRSLYAFATAALLSCQNVAAQTYSSCNPLYSSKFTKIQAFRESIANKE